MAVGKGDSPTARLADAVLRTRFAGPECALTGPLFSKLLYGLQIIYPIARRAEPPLGFGPQLGSLACRADADIEHLRVAHRRRIDRRAALGTECLGAFSAAFGSLHIDFRLSSRQAKCFLVCRNTDAKSGTRERLAICAVTYPDLLRIDFRTVGNIAAMACAIDLHHSLLLTIIRRHP